MGSIAASTNDKEASLRTNGDAGTTSNSASEQGIVTPRSSR